jgi:hypothetical protein
MFMKTVLNLVWAYLSSTGIAFAVAQPPALITFDDLSPPLAAQAGYYTIITNGYDGLNWQFFWVLDAVDSTSLNLSGYHNGLVSRKNDAFNVGGAPANFGRSTPFDFNSAYLTAAWNDGLQVEVQGIAGGSVIYDNFYTVDTFGPTLFNFDYLGVDEVNFIPSGGTQHPGFAGAGLQFVIDNLSVTDVPEPGTISLMTMGAILTCFGIRRRSFAQSSN